MNHVPIVSWASRLALCALALMVLAGCQRTAIIVTVDAEPSLATRADGWSFELLNEQGDHISVPLESTPTFPRQFTVLPSEMGGDGPFLIEARLLDGAELLGRQRLVLEFVPGATRHAAIFFGAACTDVVCTGLTSCEEGACVSACVMPGASPGEASRTSCDAIIGRLDVGPAEGDGGGLDAGVDGGLDAGVDGGHDASDDAPGDAGAPMRTPGAAIAYDFDEAPGASEFRACSGATHPTGLTVSVWNMRIPASGVTVGGGDLVMTAGAQILQARPYTGDAGTGDAGVPPDLQCLFNDEEIRGSCTDRDGFSIEAWVTPAAFGAAPIPLVSANDQDDYQSLGLFLTPEGPLSYLTTGAQQNGLPGYLARRALVAERLVHIVLVHQYLSTTDGRLDGGGADAGSPSSGTALANEVLYVDGVRFALGEPGDHALTYRSGGEVGMGECVPSRIPEGTRPGRMEIWSGVRGLRLGSRVGPDERFAGSVHLVAFYDRALTRTEVAANFAAGADADPCLMEP